MRAVITGHSDFSIKECKTKNASVFIVIPEKYLEEFSRFLQLFYTVAFDTLDEHETPQEARLHHQVRWRAWAPH